MQFGLKFFTLLALVALVGSALGQPVANEQTAGVSNLAKRWNTWNNVGTFGTVNGHWAFNNHPIFRNGGSLIWLNGGNIWNLPTNTANFFNNGFHAGLIGQLPQWNGLGQAPYYF